MASEDLAARRELAQRLVSRLRRVIDNIDSIVKDVASTRETSSTYWSGQSRALRVEYEAARGIIRDWLTTNISKEYTSTVRAEVRRLKARTLGPPSMVKVRDYLRSLTSKQSLRGLLNEVWAAFDSGLRSGQATILRMMGLTQQVLVQEARVNKAIEQGFQSGGSAIASKVKLRDALLAKSLDGKYIEVVDKNGRPIRFQLDKYAELVARTKLMEASSQAVMNTAQAVRSDLVQVSAHNTICEECSEFEGKIYSLSGDDPMFPALEAMPPFHPRCQHSLSVVIREALERDGTLDAYSEFSKGETEQHPTRESWVPVSDRELS